MKKILLIDSKPKVLLTLTQELEKLGHTIIALNSGAAGLKEATENTPDLIILTETLGDLDVEEFVTDLYKKDTTLVVPPICVVTDLPKKYQHLNIHPIEAPLHAEKIQFLLKKETSSISLDNQIFDEVLEGILENKEETDVSSKMVNLNEAFENLENKIEGYQEENKKLTSFARHPEKQSDEGSPGAGESSTKKKPKQNKTQTDTKELEHKIDTLKRDSQTLLQSKDKKILDLKRKIDALEYEISGLNQKLARSHTIVQEWKDKTSRSLKALKLAISQLEEARGDLDKVKKSA